MRYGRPAQGDEIQDGDGLNRPVSQSSAVKPTLPMSVITSYVIVVGTQGLYCVLLKSRTEDHVLSLIPCLWTIWLCQVGDTRQTYAIFRLLEQPKAWKTRYFFLPQSTWF
ncbi:hypothetical protein ElyMa_000200400 [Elysia marginata]|uniref:Uncharacterized protein n=1 Tax=Elysia marginata TaxID=1093978 RepID=A0AAV4EW68_9GAST|nr:hypothetical protein ElyMa_000200400 [Elysia marginata]